MSALGHFAQKRTLVHLFDHLIGASKDSRRNVETEYFGCLEINYKLELGRLQNGHFCHIRSFQDLPNILPRLSVHPGDAGSIAQECANCRELTRETHRGKFVLMSE